MHDHMKKKVFEKNSRNNASGVWTVSSIFRAKLSNKMNIKSRK